MEIGQLVPRLHTIFHYRAYLSVIDESPLRSLLLHTSCSRFKLCFTKIAVTIPIKAKQTNGSPHQTPNTAFSGNYMTKNIVTTATSKKQTLQYPLNTCIILRNMPLASYLSKCCTLNGFWPFISIATQSSTIP